MREILFRGKRISNGEWVEGGVRRAFHPNFDSTAQGFAMQEPNCYCICANYKDIFVEQNTIGQYTGLQDKNGKRIFEGDIVEGADFTAEDGGYGVVSFEDGAFEVSGNNITGTFHENYWGKEFEVIGNIHDNPELLEVNHEN